MVTLLRALIALPIAGKYYVTLDSTTAVTVILLCQSKDWALKITPNPITRFSMLRLELYIISQGLLTAIPDVHLHTNSMSEIENPTLVKENQAHFKLLSILGKLIVELFKFLALALTLSMPEITKWDIS